MEPQLTIKLVSQALRGLTDESSQHIPSAPQGEPTSAVTDDGAEELAALATKAIAVAIKFLISRHGVAVVPGLGRFSTVAGEVSFLPEEEFAELVSLTERDETAARLAEGNSAIAHLQRAHTLVERLRPYPEMLVELSVSDQDRLISGVFGQTSQVQLRKAVEWSVNRILSSHAQPDESRRHIGIEHNPEHDLALKYPVGTRIKGKVRNLTEFGAFVEVEEGLNALIHISDMAWSKRVKHPGEVLRKGDVVEAMVLSVDAENRRLSLGLKQLVTDIWEDFVSRHKVGDKIEGKIVRVVDFGAFVELDEDIEGLVHVSEYEVTGATTRIPELGRIVTMTILRLDQRARKIALSMRDPKTLRADWGTAQAAEARRSRPETSSS